MVWIWKQKTKITNDLFQTGEKVRINTDHLFLRYNLKLSDIVTIISKDKLYHDCYWVRKKGSILINQCWLDKL